MEISLLQTIRLVDRTRRNRNRAREINNSPKVTKAAVKVAITNHKILNHSNNRTKPNKVKNKRHNSKVPILRHSNTIIKQVHKPKTIKLVPTVIIHLLI